MSNSSVWSHKDGISWRWAMALILFAWLFAVGLRFVWIVDAGSHPARQWNGYPISNNRDSFLFGCILQKSHLGMHAENEMVPGVLRHGIITALPDLLLRVLPVSIDGLLIYTSVFVSALICVPIVLIGRLYGASFWGFLAAMLAGIAVSFFNRTLAGYYDTDMVSVTVPTAALYFLLAATRRESLALALAASLTLFVYPFFYRPGLPVGHAVGMAYVAYRIVFHRKERFTWTSATLVCLGLTCATFSTGKAVADSPGRWFLLLTVLLASYALLRGPWLPRRAMFGAAVVALAAFVVVAAPLQIIWSRAQQLHGAQQRSAGDSVEAATTKLKFLNTLTTVRETASIPMGIVAIRIMGSRPGALLALIGYIWMCFRYREMLIALPFVGLAAFACFGGLRFTVFAIPVAALSAIFLCLELATLITVGVGYLATEARSSGQERGQREKRSRRRRARTATTPAERGGPPRSVFDRLHALTSWRFWPSAFAAIVTLLLLVPNIKHIFAYRASFLDHNAVATLNAIEKDSDGSDFVLTWWDYGSAAWYYSGCRTFNSPATNSSHDNFVVSQILSTDSQRQAANLCRESVEAFVTRRYEWQAAIQAMLRNRPSDPPVDPAAYLARMAAADYVPAAKTREVYLFLPAEILRLFFAIHSFSNRDLLTGVAGSPPMYESGFPVRRGGRHFPVVLRDKVRPGRDNSDTPPSGSPSPAGSAGGGRTNATTFSLPSKMAFSNGLALDLENRRASLRGDPLALKALHVSVYGKDSRLKIGSIPFDANGSTQVIYAPQQGISLLLDSKMFKSALVQMYLFEEYDPALFEPVKLSPTAKLYRLKI